MRVIRLDDDVWAECQKLGKEHGTINEGLAAAQSALRMQEAQGRVVADEPILEVVAREVRRYVAKRGPRPKGDKTR